MKAIGLGNNGKHYCRSVRKCRWELLKTMTCLTELCKGNQQLQGQGKSIFLAAQERVDCNSSGLENRI